jgi:metacaspase-1
MATPAPRRAAALLVGIGAYRHADRIAPLRYAPRDARALARLAADPDVCGLAPDDICLLRDERAGRREIVRRLSRWLPERSAGADLALVYFAGHGVVERVGGREEGYLVPHDADPDDVCGQGISMGDVARWLDRVQARAVVLCLDCCHAGSILPGDGVSLRGDRDLSLNP